MGLSVAPHGAGYRESEGAQHSSFDLHLSPDKKKCETKLALHATRTLFLAYFAFLALFDL